MLNKKGNDPEKPQQRRNVGGRRDILYSSCTVSALIPYSFRSLPALPDRPLETRHEETRHE